MTNATTPRPASNAEDVAYDLYVKRLTTRLMERLGSTGTAAVFRTDAEGLFEAYLDALPSEHRQYHTCNCCRRFVERFGGLVVIGEDGRTRSALWDAEDAPAYYRPAAAILASRAESARVVGVFYAKDETWGWPVTGPWRHLAVTPPPELRFKHSLLTAGQFQAQKTEEYGIVRRALAEYPADVVAEALRVVDADALYRSEKVRGPLAFFDALHKAVAPLRGPARDNAVWRAVAGAPSGFCHLTQSMTATLLEDIKAGMSFEQVSKRFADKMHPLRYQRPQAPPSAGNIGAAERIFEKLGLAPALRRRYARPDEVEAVWRPAPPEDAPKGPGVFSHLRPKGASPATPKLDLPPAKITFEKFRRTVLPQAKSLEVFVATGRLNFRTFVTAADPEAPPLFDWDSPEKRNPFSSYVWHWGSPPHQYGLSGGKYHPVEGVVLAPHEWGGGPDSPRFDRHAKFVVFLVAGAKETVNTGLAVFPECLRSELREVRSTIEAYSNRALIEDNGGCTATGLSFGGGATETLRVRVTDGSGAAAVYDIDRWD